MYCQFPRNIRTTINLIFFFNFQSLQMYRSENIFIVLKIKNVAKTIKIKIISVNNDGRKKINQDAES